MQGALGPKSHVLVEAAGLYGCRAMSGAHNPDQRAGSPLCGLRLWVGLGPLCQLPSCRPHARAPVGRVPRIQTTVLG